MAVAPWSPPRPGTPIIAPSTLLHPGRGGSSMGSEEGRETSGPRTRRRVRPVRMGRTPVTNMEYAWFLAAGKAPRAAVVERPVVLDPEQPVVGVTWFEAHGLSATGCARRSAPLALPTEAEWERAGPRRARRCQRPPGGARGAPRRGAGAAALRALGCGAEGRARLRPPRTSAPRFASGATTGTRPTPTARPAATNPRGPEVGRESASAGAVPGAGTCATSLRRPGRGLPRKRVRPTLASGGREVP